LGAEVLPVKRAREFAEAFMPWAGLVVGLVALGTVHQFGSEGVFNDCRTVSPGPLLVVAFLALLACIASAIASWRSMSGSASEARRVIAVISVGSGALFVFAILLAMIAALVLPPCFQ
jgi:hypothetical protein